MVSNLWEDLFPQYYGDKIPTLTKLVAAHLYFAVNIEHMLLPKIISKTLNRKQHTFKMFCIFT